VCPHGNHGRPPASRPVREFSRPSLRKAYPPALPKASEKGPRQAALANQWHSHGHAGTGITPRRCRGVKAAGKTHAPMVQAVGRAAGHSGRAAAGAVPGAGRRGDGSGRSRCGGVATGDRAVAGLEDGRIHRVSTIPSSPRKWRIPEPCSGVDASINSAKATQHPFSRGDRPSVCGR
jgi:hypothetical protein